MAVEAKVVRSLNFNAKILHEVAAGLSIYRFGPFSQKMMGLFLEANHFQYFEVAQTKTKLKEY